MSKKRIVLLILVLLCVAIATFYYFCDTCYFIDDYFNNSIFYKYEILKLRVKLLKYSVSLKRISLKTDELHSPEIIKEILQKASKSKAVILGPSVAFACNNYDVNACQILGNVGVVAITSQNNKSYFSSILISDDKQAWDDAEASVKNKQDVLLCTDSSQLNEYFSTADYPKKLIVDYRYTGGLPLKAIYGVIAPNFAKTIPITEERGKLSYEYIKIR